MTRLPRSFGLCSQCCTCLAEVSVEQGSPEADYKLVPHRSELCVRGTGDSKRTLRLAHACAGHRDSLQLIAGLDPVAGPGGRGEAARVVGRGRGGVAMDQGAVREEVIREVLGLGIIERTRQLACLCAERWNGLELAESDVLVAVPHERGARVAEVHMLVLHCLCDAIDFQLMGDLEP